MHSVEQLVEKIKAVSHTGRSTVLVAIDGCGGSGKSTLATALSARLKSCAVVHCDDMLANPAHPQWRQRLSEQVVKPLLEDQAARYAHLDWNSGDLLEWCEVEPGGVVIVEGVSVLHSDLGNPWDVTIWVDCPRELRLIRGVNRDGENMRATWVEQWMPEEDRYVAAEQPRARADVVFDGSLGAT